MIEERIREIRTIRRRTDKQRPVHRADCCKAVELPRAEIRRQQILDAASECFGRKGFHGTNMADIAKSFGMSSAHIYNYFESKDAIITVLIARELENLLAVVGRLCGERDILKAMIARVDVGVQNQRIGGGELYVEILAEAYRNSNVAAIVQAVDVGVRKRLQKIVTATQAADERGSSAEVAAKVELMMALFDGLMMRVPRNPGLNKVALIRVLRVAIRQLTGS